MASGLGFPADDNRKWAFNLTKEIFSLRGERNGKETMICSRCSHLPPDQRGTDWQLQLAGTTKAKVHLAVYCVGLDPVRNPEDDKLRHALLISLSESSMTSKKAKVLCETAPSLSLFELWSFGLYFSSGWLRRRVFSRTFRPQGTTRG